MTDKLIISRFHQLPENLKEEVLHYIEFLQKHYEGKSKPVTHEKRQFGSAKDKYKLSPDFNAPLDDFNAYM